MCSPHDLPDTAAAVTLGDPPPLLDDYLDHLCAPLIGVMPHPQRRQLRLEVRLHVEALAEEWIAQGQTPQDALTAAMNEFGEPWRVGETMLREVALREGSPLTAGRRRAARPATEHGLAWLGLPAAICLFLLTRQTVDSPTTGDAFLPLFVGLTLLTPLFGGALTGLTAPAGAESGVCRALGVVGLFSLGVALLLLPSPAGLVYLGIEAACWLPVGWLSARATISARRQYRRGRFLRLAGRMLPHLSSQGG